LYKPARGNLVRAHTPEALGFVGALAGSDGTGGIGRARKGNLGRVHLLLGLGKGLVELLDPIAGLLHRVDLRGGVLLVFPEPGDLLRGDVLLVLELFDLDDRAAPLGIELEEALAEAKFKSVPGGPSRAVFRLSSDK